MFFSTFRRGSTFPACDARASVGRRLPRQGRPVAVTASSGRIVRLVMSSSTAPYSTACSAVRMKSRSKSSPRTRASPSSACLRTPTETSSSPPSKPWSTEPSTRSSRAGRSGRSLQWQPQEVHNRTSRDVPAKASSGARTESRISEATGAGPAPSALGPSAPATRATAQASGKGPGSVAVSSRPASLPKRRSSSSSSFRRTLLERD